MSDNYISVSQVNNYIKNIFDSEVLLSNICVYGEIGNYSMSNGYAYFNLKDENGLLQCVMFNATKFARPNVGDKILATGSISYYAKGGKLSFNVYSIAPYGKGALYEKFIALKEKLSALGYFDEARKKPLPDSIKRVCVISSSTGAVIQDIRNVAFRRNPTIDIVLYPVKVQGIGCDIEVAEGVKYFNTHDHNIDCIIIARGGGSMEDLDGFNSEVLANAIYESNIPIVSAVGHETDFTICDFVSDLRAPTPSAGAELVTANIADVRSNILNMLYTISLNIDHQLQSSRNQIFYSVAKLDNTIKDKLNNNKNVILSNITNINHAIELLLNNAYNNITINKKILDNINPSKIMSMGYAKISKDGESIKNANALHVGDNIDIEMLDGKIIANVEGVNDGI